MQSILTDTIGINTMKYFELNILTEAELRDRPVYVFRRPNREGAMKYLFVKHDGPNKTITLAPAGESNLLFYTNREDAERALQKFNDPLIKLSLMPISQIRYIEKKFNKKPDESGYVLLFQTPNGQEFGYRAVTPDGKYSYTVGKSKYAQRNKILKFDNPKDASYFARHYFPGERVAIRPVEGSSIT